MSPSSFAAQLADHTVLLPRRLKGSVRGAYPLLPCSAPLPQEELADSCPSEIPVSTPPQAARLQEARHTNSGSALAYSQGMI